MPITNGEDLRDPTSVRASEGSESQTRKAEGGERGRGGAGESAFNGDGATIWEDEKVVQAGGADAPNVPLRRG